jgi:hypothetical protein
LLTWGLISLVLPNNNITSKYIIKYAKSFKHGRHYLKIVAKFKRNITKSNKNHTLPQTSNIN